MIYSDQKESRPLLQKPELRICLPEARLAKSKWKKKDVQRKELRMTGPWQNRCWTQTGSATGEKAQEMDKRNKASQLDDVFVLKSFQ